MSTVAETIITISAVIGAIGVIWGVIYGVIKWVQRQNQQTDNIKSLKKLHKSDVESMQKKEREDMQDIDCFWNIGLSYAAYLQHLLLNRKNPIHKQFYNFLLCF